MKTALILLILSGCSADTHCKPTLEPLLILQYPLNQTRLDGAVVGGYCEGILE